MPQRRSTNQASKSFNWLRREKRLAIYLRDGLACIYCGSSDRLTLDHLTPLSRRGTNHPDNLVSACGPCNTRKAQKPWYDFVTDEAAIRLITSLRKPLDLSYARLILAAAKDFPSALRLAQGIQSAQTNKSDPN